MANIIYIAIFTSSLQRHVLRKKAHFWASLDEHLLYDHRDRTQSARKHIDTIKIVHAIHVASHGVMLSYRMGFFCFCQLKNTDMRCSFSSNLLAYRSNYSTEFFLVLLPQSDEYAHVSHRILFQLLPVCD